MKLPNLLKIAATITVAAIILTMVTLNLKKTTDIPSDNNKTAKVQFTENKGKASVQIQTASVNSQVTVDLGNKKTLAKCNIEIIDSNGGLKENINRPTWIIISRPQPVYADNEINQDMMDIMYLF